MYYRLRQPETVLGTNEMEFEAASDLHQFRYNPLTHHRHGQ